MLLHYRCEVEARALFAAAKASPGIYSESIAEATQSYNSESWEQYGFWAAAWLYSLTSESSFKTVRSAPHKGEIEQTHTSCRSETSHHLVPYSM